MNNKIDWKYIDVWSKKIRAINHLGGKCKKCGNDNIFHLCFHHTNSNNKEFVINKIRYNRYSTILKEIEKCEIFKLLKYVINLHNDDTKPLKPDYKHIVISTDFDSDGFHICGLIINMFDKYWPKMLEYMFIK